MKCIIPAAWVVDGELLSLCAQDLLCQCVFSRALANCVEAREAFHPRLPSQYY